VSKASKERLRKRISRAAKLLRALYEIRGAKDMSTGKTWSILHRVESLVQLAAGKRSADSHAKGKVRRVPVTKK
jgi:hypothetical protein